MSLLSLFNPPRITPPNGGRYFIDGKPATAAPNEPSDINRDAREAHAEKQRAYYERNRKKVSARKRDYQKRNRKEIEAYQKAYREKRRAEKGASDGNQ